MKKSITFESAHFLARQLVRSKTESKLEGKTWAVARQPVRHANPKRIWDIKDIVNDQINQEISIKYKKTSI